MKNFTLILFFLIIGSISKSEWCPNFIVLDTTHNALFRLSGSNLQSTQVGTLAPGDYYELFSATKDYFYTSNRSTEEVLKISISDFSIISKIKLDKSIYIKPRGFDFSPNGQLYGILEEMKFCTIDLTNGQTTSVANITGASVIEAIAFAPNGTLYAVGAQTGTTYSTVIYEINLYDGTVTLIADMKPSGIKDIDCLTYAPDGYLYGTDSLDGWSADLYRINPITGEVSILGNTGVTGLNGILAIPEPCTLLLLGVGGVILRKRK